VELQVILVVVRMVAKLVRVVAVVQVELAEEPLMKIKVE
jgi:hypothetical protein